MREADNSSSCISFVLMFLFFQTERRAAASSAFRGYDEEDEDDLPRSPVRDDVDQTAKSKLVFVTKFRINFVFILFILILFFMRDSLICQIFDRNSVWF